MIDFESILARLIASDLHTTSLNVNNMVIVIDTNNMYLILLKIISYKLQLLACP